MITDEALRKIPKLGFGLMRLPEKNSGIDGERLNKMADIFLENGFTYFDTAYVYHGGKSETAFRSAVVDRYPRDRFTIADKLPGWILKSESDVQKVFDEQLKRTGAGYFDFYLLHNAEAKHLKTYNRLDCWQWAQKMKQNGLIRHFGFSFHDTPQLLDQILTAHPEAEFVQLQLNYFDWDNVSANSGKCYEVARKHGKPVIVMEPVKGGALASLPAGLEEKMRSVAPGRSIPSWALRFCASLDGVMVVLSGIDIPEVFACEGYYDRQMARGEAENTPEYALTERLRFWFGNQPLAKQRYARMKIRADACTQCGRCLKDCPYGIDIPHKLHLAHYKLSGGGIY